MISPTRSSLVGLALLYNVSNALVGCGQKGPLYMQTAETDQVTIETQVPDCPTKRCQAKQPTAEATE